MIQLAARFVPAADEVWRLQRGSDPECKFFQQMSRNGHYGDRPEGSQQGIYVVSPSGKFLASANTNRPEHIVKLLQRGLRAWDALAASERKLAAEADIAPLHRWEDSYPDDGLVLSCFVRDLPEQCDPTAECEVKWNRDYVWCSRSEARQWLADGEPQVGEQHVLPEQLLRRLAQFHLVDVVKGQTWRFTEQQIDGRIVTEVVARDGALVRVKISGNTKADSPGAGRRAMPHGVATEILGTATFDLQQGAFVEFEMVALGTRWGRTRFNGRYRDPQSGPLGFVFRLVPPNAPRVAPAFIAAYNADWVVRPER